MGEQETNTPSRQSLSGEFIERRGKAGGETHRERQRDAERKRYRKKREVGGVLPFKGSVYYCLPCMHCVMHCQVLKGWGQVHLDNNNNLLIIAKTS